VQYSLINCKLEHFRMNAPRTTKLILAALGFLTLTASARAEEILLEIDRTQLVTLSAPPATVVVGNPAIADVTVNGNQVFINAFAAGGTNIIMLDSTGNAIASLDVSVSQGGARRTASMFKNGQRQSLVCVDFCDPTMQVGDGPEYFEGVNNQYRAKRMAALGMIESNRVVTQPNQNGQTPQ
jgi:hypothetical protein